LTLHPAVAWLFRFALWITTDEVPGVLDALERDYPVLRGAIRDRVTERRRPFVRFFACEQDLSHVSSDTLVPAAVVAGKEPFLIVGALAGG